MLTSYIGLARKYSAVRLYMLSTFQSSLGTGAAVVALILLAYDRTHSAWGITAILAVTMVALILFALPLGILADRRGRRKVAVACDVLRCGAFLGAWLAQPFWLLITFVFLVGVGTAGYSAVAPAVFPLLTEEADGPLAQGAFQFVTYLGETLGPLICVGLLSLFAPTVIMLLNAVTFGINALIVLRLPFPEISHQQEEQAGFFKNLLGGWSAVAHHKSLLVMTFSLALFAAAGEILTVGEPVLAIGGVGASASFFALMYTFNNGGYALGSLLSSAASERTMIRGWLLGIGGTVGAALAYASFTNRWLLLLPFLMLGVGNGMMLSSAAMLITKLADSHKLARVFGFMGALGNLGALLGFLAAANVISDLGARASFLLAAAGLLAVLGLTTYGLRKEFWEDAASNSPGEKATSTPILGAEQPNFLSPWV